MGEKLKSIDTRKMTPYRLAELIAWLVSELKAGGLNGSLRELKEITGRSKSYLSTLRATWESTRDPLRAAWLAGDVPIDLVVLLAGKEGAEQDQALELYLAESKGRSRDAKSAARARLLNKRRCSHDGGTCHHNCGAGPCYRQGIGASLTTPHKGYPKV